MASAAHVDHLSYKFGELPTIEYWLEKLKPHQMVRILNVSIEDFIYFRLELQQAHAVVPRWWFLLVPRVDGLHAGELEVYPGLDVWAAEEVEFAEFLVVRVNVT